MRGNDHHELWPLLFLPLLLSQPVITSTNQTVANSTKNLEKQAGGVGSLPSPATRSILKTTTTTTSKKEKGKASPSESQMVFFGTNVDTGVLRCKSQHDPNCGTGHYQSCCKYNHQMSRYPPLYGYCCGAGGIYREDPVRYHRERVRYIVQPDYVAASYRDPEEHRPLPKEELEQQARQVQEAERKAMDQSMLKELEERLNRRKVQNQFKTSNKGY
ncbi:hypothetical protein IE53DRAFT_371362 [Violaceomyces palustris]|uniref:Uncharacterized protein n=1 Tax=Violaceomyces palustris TaxID=1673888 RepID=A0ACD0NP09_9BASI|nr:hypothetical protein IE53DRAFT_371362 [Violaceomyces palustris]